MIPGFIKKIFLILALLSIIKVFSQSGDNKIFTLPNDCEVVKVLEGIAPDEKYFIRGLDEHVPAIIGFDHIFLLNDSTAEPIYFSFQHPINDIHFDNSDVYFAAGSIIYLYNDKMENLIPVVISDDLINSFRISNNNLIVPQSTTINLYSLNTPKEHKRFNVKIPVENIEVLGDEIMFSSGNDLYLLKGNEFYKLFQEDRPIKTFVILPSADIIYSTDEGIFYLTSRYERLHITDEIAKKLVFIEDSLYIVSEDNSCTIITNITSFSTLLHTKE